MEYLEYTFSGLSDVSTTEILIAMLNEAGYAGFVEKKGSLSAYIPASDQNENHLGELLSKLQHAPGKLVYSCISIPETNWNEKWESSFEPIIVEERVFIRAPFHPPSPSCEYEIIIEPKMSFGTGHHETTRLMISAMLSLDFRKKQVLDMGCGTGVLGILASKLGAQKILGIDMDEWACRNSIENTHVNNCKNLLIKKGDASEIPGEQFDILLANINRNILLSDMPIYSEALAFDGVLVISGILRQDKEIIVDKARQLGLRFSSQMKENDWLSIIFKKEAGI